MPEEHDTATVGTASNTPEPEPTRLGSHRNVAFATGIAMVTALGVVAVVLFVTSPGEADTSRAVVAKRTLQRSAPELTDANSSDAITSTSSTLGATTTTLAPSRGETSAPVAPMIESSPPAPPAPPASVPGTPVVTISASVGAGGCTASWTTDDGGSPLVDYIVTHESAPAPPGPGGVEIGTAMRVGTHQRNQCIRRPRRNHPRLGREHRRIQRNQRRPHLQLRARARRTRVRLLSWPCGVVRACDPNPR